jgi:hypothetical protein
VQDPQSEIQGYAHQIEELFNHDARDVRQQWKKTNQFCYVVSEPTYRHTCVLILNLMVSHQFLVGSHDAELIIPFGVFLLQKFEHLCWHEQLTVPIAVMENLKMTMKLASNNIFL